MRFSNQAFLFWSHFYFSCPFFVLCWYLLDTCNMGSASANLKKVDTKVLTLPVNKDKNAAAVFYISIEHLS